MERLLSLLFWLLFPSWLGEAASRGFPGARNPGALLVVSVAALVFAWMLRHSSTDVIDILVGLFMIGCLAAVAYGLMAWWFPKR